MRICISTPYYVPVKGGISNYISNLVTTLDKMGYNISVIARYGNVDANVYVITQKFYFIIKSYLILSKKKPDIIHAHSNWYTLTPSVIYKIIHPKTRLIFTFHTEPIGKMKGFKKIVFQWLLSNCDAVTFVSKALMKKIGENLKITSTKKVIYAGVSAKKVSEEEVQQFKERFSLKNDKPIVSFIGPLAWKQKVEGVKILIKSFKIIKDRYPNSKLIIIGDGEYKKELQQLTEKLNIKNNVVFTGFLDNVFVPLEVIDIYAHISLQEGFPISLLEAMCIGKPVIATKVGGIPEVIINNENGVLVGPDSIIIAEKIRSLYENKEKCKNMAQNAIRTVETNYNWNKITEQFIDIYKT